MFQHDDTDDDDEDAASTTASTATSIETRVTELLPDELGLKTRAESNASERPRLVMITAFASEFNRDCEPIIHLESVEKAAYQLEVAPTTGSIHVHVALQSVRRLTEKSLHALLKQCFPKTGLEGKDVRLATKGTSAQAIINYVTKEASRAPGEEPQFYNCQHSDTLPKRKMEELEKSIHECDTIAELNSGQTSGVYRHNTTTTVKMHAERPFKRPVLDRREQLFAWERALFGLVNRQPIPNFIHWFVADTMMELDRVARLLRKVLGAKKQSRQMAYYCSMHPKDAFLNHISCHTRAIFMTSVADQPISNDFLIWMKTRTMAHNSHSGRYDVQELKRHRHVIVFSFEKPALKNKLHKEWTRVWTVDKNTKEWAHTKELLTYGQTPENGKPFLNLRTVGVSGAVDSELESEVEDDGTADMEAAECALAGR
jgi:hypothetical protein